MRLDQDAEKRLNYLYWLEDRGIAQTPRGQSAPHAAISQNSSEDRSHEKGHPAAKEGKKAKCRLIIVSDRLAEKAEIDMVQRIAAAIGVDVADYGIALNVSALGALLTTARSDVHILVLGPGGTELMQHHHFDELAIYELRRNAQGGSALLIPHPQNMLVHPHLKMKAWEVLQKLKSLLASPI